MNGFRKTFPALASLAAIALVGSIASAGISDGPEMGTHTVEAYETQEFNEEFVGGERAIVLIEGDGDTDLDLFVYDGLGNLVASDTDLTDFCLGVWLPEQTGTYRIVVENHGSVYNEFVIFGN